MKTEERNVFDMNLKRRIAIILTGLLLVTMMTGCSGKQSTSQASSSEETITIRFAGWGEPEEKELYATQILPAFEKEHPNIKVKYEHIPADFTGKMNVALASGSAPDVFYVGDGDFSRWAKLGQLYNIQEFVDQEQFDLTDIFEQALVRYRYDGTITGKGDLYCLPMDIAPIVMYYNKELFDAAGVAYPSAEEPMTWEELLEVGQKLTDESKRQYGIGSIWWEGMVWGNGGQILSDDRTEFVLNEEKGAEAMQFIADCTNKYGICPPQTLLDSQGADQMFETGKVAMYITGRYMVPPFRKLNFDWDIAPQPCNGEWSGYSASTGFGISAKTKEAEVAWELVKFLSGKEANELRAGLCMPIYKSMASTDLVLQPDEKPSHSEVFVTAAQNQQPGPWTYVPDNKWWDTLNQNLSRVWEGKEPAQDILTELKPQIEKALKEGNPDLYQ